MSNTRWNISKKPQSAPFIRSARRSCASGPSRRTSIPPSKSSPIRQSARIFERAFRTWFQQKLAKRSRIAARPGPHGLARFLPTTAADRPTSIRRRKLIEWRDHPSAVARTAFRSFHAKSTSSLSKSSWRPKPPPAAANSTTIWYRSLRPAHALVDLDRARGKSHHARARLRHARKSSDQALRDLERDTKKGSGFFAESVPREQVVARRALS